MTKLIYACTALGAPGSIIYALSDRRMAMLQFRKGRASASIPIQPFWTN
jgi:hypothetical protein